MSEVVPPISQMMASCAPVRAAAPMTLAAGPDSTVSAGQSNAMDSCISVPSPLTIMTGAEIPCASSTWWTDDRNSRMIAVRLAWRIAVTVRS